MAETRVIIGHAQHDARGPHLEQPADFTPLKLSVEGQHLHIEIACLIAIVGRHTDADLRFAYADISRRHCKLAFDAGQWRVYDLKSMNGIYINNVPIVEGPLYSGDVLRVGGIRMLVESGTPLRLSRDEEEKHEKLRQIVDVLPTEKAG